MFNMPILRKRNNFNQLIEFDRNKIMGLDEAKISFRELAWRLNKNVM